MDKDEHKSMCEEFLDKLTVATVNTIFEFEKEVGVCYPNFDFDGGLKDGRIFKMSLSSKEKKK